MRQNGALPNLKHLKKAILLAPGVSSVAHLVQQVCNQSIRALAKDYRAINSAKHYITLGFKWPNLYRP